MPTLLRLFYCTIREQKDQRIIVVCFSAMVIVLARLIRVIHDMWKEQLCFPFHIRFIVVKVLWRIRHFVTSQKLDVWTSKWGWTIWENYWFVFWMLIYISDYWSVGNSQKAVCLACYIHECNIWVDENVGIYIFVFIHRMTFRLAAFIKASTIPRFSQYTFRMIRIFAMFTKQGIWMSTKFEMSSYHWNILVNEKSFKTWFSVFDTFYWIISIWQI